MPGLRDEKRANHKTVFVSPDWMYLPQSVIIDGAKSRDPGNGTITVLRPGVLMGLITSSQKYAPSVIGSLQSAAASAATSITVTAAEATELVRRVGSTGTITLTGPPTSAGTVATFTETYSAVNTTTGVITCSALNAALVAGSLVSANDGSETPKTLIPDGYGIQVSSDGTDLDVEFDMLPVGGIVDDGELLPWPSDTSLRTWIREKLSTVSGGKFVFGDQY